MAKNKKTSALDRIELVEGNVIYVDFRPRPQRRVDTIEVPSFFGNMMITDADLEALLGTPITIESVSDDNGDLIYVTIVDRPESQPHITVY